MQRLEIFGSAAESASLSDVGDLDFLVQFGPLPPGRRADAYFELREALADLLGRDVDLVVDRAIRTPYFRRAVDESRRPVYTP